MVEINDEVLKAYSLPSTATHNDLYMNIFDRLMAIMNNKAFITLTVKDQNGRALKNVLFSRITDISGNPLRTSDSGTVEGYINEGSTVLEIKDYADIEDYSQSISCVKGEEYTLNWTVNRRNFVSILSSKNIMFTSDVRLIAFTIGGGGGRGGNGVGRKSSVINTPCASTGGGGGGGYVVEKTDLTVESDTPYPVTIGGSGGASTFMNITANAGANGSSGDLTRTDAVTANGNGRGGAAQTINAPNNSTGYTKSVSIPGGNGSLSMYSSFTEKTNYGGGGGSGSWYIYFSGGTSGMYHEKQGAGSPGGGNGGGLGSSAGNPSTAYRVDGDPGINGLGGGGGGGSAECGNYSVQGNGAAGGSGQLAIRMYFS